jgi:hypothetical protein
MTKMLDNIARASGRAAWGVSFVPGSDLTGDGVTEVLTCCAECAAQTTPERPSSPAVCVTE